MTGAGALQRLAGRLLPATGGVHVLAYHLVGAGTRSPVDVPAADFRAQMEGLARRGGAISLDEAVERLTAPRSADPAGGDPASVAVVLTFDDAYRNFARRAWPLLRDLGLPATLFVPTAFVDRGEPVPMALAGDLPAMSWDELAAARREGLTLGSHSHAHGELPAMTDDEITDDLARARQLLAQRTGSDARHFCYPRALWDRRTERLVARFHSTVSVAGGRLNRPARPARATAGPLRLQRVPVRNDLGPDLDPLVDSAVWLREWLADAVRRRRAARRHRRTAPPRRLG